MEGSDPTDVTPSFDSDNESDDGFETPPEEMIEENKGVSIIETEKGVSLRALKDGVVNMLELSNVNVKEEISPVVADQEESTELKVDTQQFEDIKRKVVSELFLQQYFANSLYQEYMTMIECQTACHNEEKYYSRLAENKERVVRRDIRNQQTSEKVETLAVGSDEEECVTNEAVISDDSEAVISDDSEAVISDDKINELEKDDEIKREEVELNRTLLEDTKPQQHTMYEQYLANSVSQSYQLLMEHKRLNDHEEAYQCIEAKKIVQDNEQTLLSHDEKEDTSHISTSKSETSIDNRMEENNGTGEIKENAISDTTGVSDTTDAIPDTTDAVPDTTDDTTDLIPDTTDAVPDTTDAVPDTTDDTTDVISDITNVITDTTDAIPDTTDDTTDLIPDITDAVPDTTDDTTDLIPDITDAVPDTTDDTTDLIPDTTDAVPDTTDAVPDTTDAVPDTTDDTTDVITDTTDAVPDTTDVITDTTDAVLDTTDVITDTTDVISDTTDAVLDATDDTTNVITDTTDAIPDTTDDTTDLIPDTTDAVPDTTDDTTDLIPDTTDAVPDTTDAVPDTTDAVPDTTDDTTDVITDTTDAVPDTTDVITDTTDAVLDTTDVITDTTDVISDTTDAVLDATDDTTDDTTDAVPDTTDVITDTTDAVLDTTDVITDTTDVISDNTDAVPDTTDAVPDTTDAVPDATDDTTDVKPDTTDVIPDTTDAVPYATDVISDTTDAVLDATDDTTDVITDTTDAVPDTTDTTDTADILHTLTDTKVPETTLIYNDIGVNTDATPTLTDVATNTQTKTNYDISTNTVIIETKDTECLANIEYSHACINTDISAFELLKQVHSNEKFLRMEEELKLKTIELNDEKSKRMVNDNLVSILQSDITSIQQRNIDESTTRIRMNGEIAELKAELKHSQKEVTEKEQRVTELDESLAGTLLLVRKIEEQSSVMINKGGVDYLLQAKIADGRAHEAEQKLEVLQADLLQSQAEVQRLLDRLSEFSRERREMVSSKVHTQLLQISDERAEMAERRIKELEQELMHLKSSTKQRPSQSNNILGSYPAGSSSLYGYSSYTSPYSTSYTGMDYTRNEERDYYSPGIGISSISSPAVGVGSSYSSYTGGLTYNDTRSYHNEPVRDTATTMSLGIKVLPSVLQPPSSKPDVHRKKVMDNELPEIDLPSISSVSMMETIAPPIDTCQQKKKDESCDSNSDWSSSDDDDQTQEDCNRVNVADNTNETFRPTSHMNLKSRWEWLSQNKDQPSPPSTAQKKPRRPPIAPKPKPPTAPKPKLHVIHKTSKVAQESPVSFDEPPAKPSLQFYRRTSGPEGRRRPSKTSTD